MSAPRESPPGLPFHEARILIVDDQPANISLLEETLHQAGYTNVSSTLNPLEVCALHRRNDYDLILLDLQMPGMDGFQVIEGLKTNEKDAYLPVLVITAQPGHKLRALQAGAKDFISKPFDLVEATTRVHYLLEVRLLYRRMEQHNRELEEAVRERTAELRESEARYRSLTELASDWYWEQDEHGNFTKVSGPVLEMLGVRVEGLGSGGGPGQVPGWDATQRAALDARRGGRSHSAGDHHHLRRGTLMTSTPPTGPADDPYGTSGRPDEQSQPGGQPGQQPGFPPPPSAYQTTGSSSCSTISSRRSVLRWFMPPCVPASTVKS